MKRNLQFLGALGLACLTAALPACKKKDEAVAKAQEAHEKVKEHANAAADAAAAAADKAKAHVEDVKAKAASLVPDLQLTGSPSEKLTALLGSTVVALGKAKGPQEVADTLRGVLKKYDVAALRTAAKEAKAKGQGASKATLQAFKAQKEALKKMTTEMGKKSPEIIGPAVAEFSKAWGLN